MQDKDNAFRHEPLKYNTFRPIYPTGLFAYLKKISGAERVLECGSGSGQATKVLIRNFKEVIACDISENLLKQCIPFENLLRVYGSVATNL